MMAIQHWNNSYLYLLLLLFVTIIITVAQFRYFCCTLQMVKEKSYCEPNTP